MAFRGAIFDVDGVLVDSPHEPPWREAFRGLMEGERGDIRAQTRYSPERFTPALYQQRMAGMPPAGRGSGGAGVLRVPDVELGLGPADCLVVEDAPAASWRPRRRDGGAEGGPPNDRDLLVGRAPSWWCPPWTTSRRPPWPRVGWRSGGWPPSSAGGRRSAWSWTCAMGTLLRRLAWEDAQGRRTRMVQRRL
jgi:hypothetical protein